MDTWEDTIIQYPDKETLQKLEEEVMNVRTSILDKYGFRKKDSHEYSMRIEKQNGDCLSINITGHPIVNIWNKKEGFSIPIFNPVPIYEWEIRELVEAFNTIPMCTMRYMYRTKQIIGYDR